MDVGGTFTDLVAIVGDEVVTAKVPSTPRDQSEGVIAVIEAAQIQASDVDAFAHGTTVATNALLERRGARTALVTTDGFADVIEIARQTRPSLYDLTEHRPPPLVERDLRFTVTERMGPEGQIVALDESQLNDVVAAIRKAEPESAAVCLLFSFAHPEHEERVAKVLREALSDVHVSVSSEVLPEFREYERFATTTADAYLAPKLGSYLRRLSEKTQEKGVPAPVVMQSSGGVIDIETASERAAACVVSGPAGGVVGAAYAASASDLGDVLTFDMGGTSTDVCAVVGGEIVSTTESDIAGVPIRFPAVDLHTVSAGGGSIGWADPGGALRVGPHSAGADPGPAAYGSGGNEPTVTDANLYLGYLADGAELGGSVVLQKKLAEQALEQVGKDLGLDVLDTALGIVRVANAEMLRALRVVTVERGLDPREFSLVCFGGAGPMHACALAEELGIIRVAVPKASGVLSAFGLAISDARRDYVRSLLTSLHGIDDSGFEEAFAEMESRARADLDEPQLTRRADLRYPGQSFELTVDAGDPSDMQARFHDSHERRYGFRMDDEVPELVSVRLIASSVVPKPELKEPPGGDAGERKRSANFDGEWVEVPVFDRLGMGRGSSLEGPAIVEFPEATCVVRPGWSGAIDRAGTLILERK